MKRLPKNCPSCGGGLRVKTMYCEGCDTTIVGEYPLPPLMSLSEDDQAFVCDFVRCSGSLKEMAQKLSLSYPTVRNRLDDIIEALNAHCEVE